MNDNTGLRLGGSAEVTAPRGEPVAPKMGAMRCEHPPTRVEAAAQRLGGVLSPHVNLPDPSAHASRDPALRRYPRLVRAEQPEAIAAFGGTYCRYPAGLAAFSPTSRRAPARPKPRR